MLLYELSFSEGIKEVFKLLVLLLRYKLPNVWCWGHLVPYVLQHIPAPELLLVS